MPVSVVAYISFSHHDITGARRTHVRHLERVDVVVTMRRHHLLHELLRQYLRLPSAAAVMELTLCVDDNNGDAKLAYASYGFRPLYDDVWVLDELEGSAAGEEAPGGAAEYRVPDEGAANAAARREWQTDGAHSLC